MSRFGYRSLGSCCSERFATATIGTFDWRVRGGNPRRSCSRQTASLSSRNCASPTAARAFPTSGTLDSHDDRSTGTVRYTRRRIGTRWCGIDAMFAPVRQARCCLSSSGPKEVRACQFLNRFTNTCVLIPPNWANELYKAIRRFKWRTILCRPYSPCCFESRSLPRPSPRWVFRKSGRGSVALQ